MSELDRQAAVLAAWRTPLPAGVPLDATQPCWPWLQNAGLKTDAAGLLAYQINAQATAQRVLASTYPSMSAMLGAQTLNALALILWQQAPPTCGDLGEWGGALPALLAAHPDLQAWPWLPDSARLDWARHVSERAADADLDAQSLHWLGDAAPTHVHLWLKPCVQVLTSNWPITELWHAHQLPAGQQAEAARQALSQVEAGRASEQMSEQASAVVVWRQPWQLHMQALTGAQAAWMLKLAAWDTSLTAADANTDNTKAAQQPVNLASLLDQAWPDFDFTDWLTQALSQGWLWRVTVSA